MQKASCKKIDPNTWPRKAHCDFFGGLEVPFYSVTFPVDATKVYRVAKARELSFYLCMIYAATRAVNRVQAFRYKLRGEGVVLWDTLSPSFTIPWGDGLFAILNMDFDPTEDLAAFCSRASQLSAALTKPLPDADEDARDDLIYFSCLPWLSYTQVTQEHSLDRGDSVPRLMWGRFTKEDEAIRLPFTVQVNHRLIDGAHLGALNEALTAEFTDLYERELSR